MAARAASSAERSCVTSTSTTVWVSPGDTRTTVAVISGGNFEQFEAQLVSRLEAFGEQGGVDETALERLHLLPTCGTRYERREGGAWRTVYQENLEPAQRDAAPSRATSTTINFAPVIDARGADAAQIAVLRRDLKRMADDMPKTIAATLHKQQVRGTI